MRRESITHLKLKVATLMGYFLGCLSGVRSSPAIVEAEVKLDSIRSAGIFGLDSTKAPQVHRRDNSASAARRLGNVVF